MNGFMGQLPEWMRSPAALSVGGLVLLLVLVLVFRRRGGSAHGLPTGRGWRSKVPLPSQASSLDAMRAALASSRNLDPRRQPEPPAEPPEVAPAAESVSEVAVADAATEDVKRLPQGEASNADRASEQEAPTADAAADATAEADEASDADAAKVVPLPVGTAGSEARTTDASPEAAPDEDVAPAPARKQKG